MKPKFSLGLMLCGLLFASASFAAVGTHTVNVIPSSTSFGATTGQVTFTVNITYTEASLGGLGFEITQPAGWKFVSSAGTNSPDLKPATDQTGKLPFAYFTVPSSPVSFTFTSSYPAGLSAAQVFTLVTGRFTDADTADESVTTASDITLTLSAAPTITSANNATFLVGQSNTFTVTATGSPAPTLGQSGTLPSGVTFNTTTGVLAGTPTATGSFPLTFTASNGVSPNATQSFTLAVNAAPAITTQPVAKTVIVGNATTFTVAASGTPAPTIQWQGLVPGAGGVWSDLSNTTQFSGVTTTTLTVNANLSALNGYKFRAVATNGVGTPATSDEALLTVQFAPTVTVSPSNPTADLDSTVTFTATATGNPAPTFQWKKAGVDIGGATNATLVLSHVTGANAGSYTVVATNGIGTAATSTASTLSLNPGIGGFTPASGSVGTSVVITGAGFTGATGVSFNGVPVPTSAFTVDSNFQITATVPTFATTGVISVTPATGSALTTTTPFTVTAGSRLINQSSRFSIAAGGDAYQSFTINGSVPQQMVIRAVGPGLATFGITGAIADPQLTLYNGKGEVVTSNDNWDSANASAFSAVGAFALTAGSKDAAIVTILSPGTYTTRVSGVGSASGILLLETYETPVTNNSDRLAYLSTRLSAGTGADTATIGFALSGTGAKQTVLVRAVGAGLGIAGALADPRLTVLSGSTQVATNDDWTSTNVSQSDLAAATAAVGAMPLSTKDSALLLTLASGPYTLQVTPVTGAAGTALVEIFVVDAQLPATYPAALLAPLPNQNPALGGTISFAAQAVGKPFPTVQWQKDSADLPGKTNFTLSLTNVTSANSGAYGVVLTNTAGAVTSATADVGVAKAAQTITFNALAAATYNQAPITLGATSTSNLPVSYTSSNTNVATVSGNQLTIVGAGTSIITASQPGSPDFLAASNVTQTLTVNKATATIALSNLSSVFDNTPKAVTATTTPAGLNVAITYAGSSTAPTNAGTYAIVATISGATPPESNYQGTQTGTLTIAKADQVIAFSAVPTDKIFGNGTFTLTATGGASGNPVTFSSSNTAVATVSSNVVTIVGAGTTTLTANQAGNGNYNAANAFGQTFNVAKADQSISFGALGNKTFGDAPFALSATATSTLAPTFTVLTGPATISGSTLTITGAGTVTVRAAQIGNGNYNAAATVDQSFDVAKANQTIAFTPPPSVALDQSPVALTATATGGPVTFATSNAHPNVGTGSVATLTGNILVLSDTGTIDVTASAAANANFNAATSVTRTLTVTGQSQTITFDAAQLPAKTFSPGQTFTISAATNRTGYLIAFTTSDANVATVATGTLGADGKTTTAMVTIIGAGTATITATQAGDANTGTATPVPRTLTVAKAAQTVSFGTIVARGFGDPDFTVSATASSTLPVAYSSGNTAVATVDSSTGLVHIVGAGSAVITAAQAGNTNYNAATSVNQTLTVAKAAQTITGLANTTKLINAGSFTLSATASSTLAVTYTSSNSAVATVSGNTVTIVGLGTTTLTASQAGNTNYNAATPVTATLTVNPVAPQIVNAPATVPAAIRGSAFLYGPLTLNALSAPATFTATGLPAGLTINGASGNISGTPTVEGTFPVTITVTNATSTDSKSISIVVQPPAPAITSAAAASAVAGTAFTYTPTATPATGVTFTAGTLPSWLSFNGTALTGTPTQSGTYTVPITATNATGAVTLPLTITVTLPANAPVYSGPLNPSGTAGVAFSFTPNFGTGTTTYAMPSGTLPTGLSFNSTTGAITGTTQVVGVFPVTITATRVGLTATANLNITINPAPTAPIVVFPTGGNVRTGTAGAALTSFTLTANPATPTPTFAVVSGSLPTGVNVSAAGVVSGTPGAQGTFTAQITATNSAGGTGPAATLQFTINPGANAPVITSAPVVQGRVNVALSYTITASPASPAATFGVTGSVPGMSLAGSTFSGTPTTSGTFTVFFAGTNTDPAGGTGEAMDVVFNIAPPLTVPVVNSNGTAAAQVGQAFNYTVTATNGPTSFAATGLPAGLTLNTGSGVISGVPTTATSGTPVTVTLTASNADGASNPKSLLITIAPAPATPVVTSGTVASGRVGTTFTYQITATETPTSYVATGLPAGLAVSPTTGVISGTPTVSGPFTASIAAANAGGVGAAAPLNFTIAPAATAPVITSAGAASGQVGTAFTYAITTSGGTVTSYAITGTLPSGLALNSSTGAISGSPTAAGTFTVGLTATGDGGTSLPQPLVITINPALGVPVITSPGGAIGTAGANFNYTITASNMPAAPFPPGSSLDAVNLPSGLAVNPATGVIQGVPAAAGTTTASLFGTNTSGTGSPRDLVITVQPPLTAPVVNSATLASGQVGVNFAYTITATNTPSSFEVLGAPIWMTLNSASGVVAGSPTAPGPITVQLVASNSAGTSNPVPLTINVAARTGTPSVGSPRNVTGQVGATLVTYQISADNAPTSYAAIGLPPGLTVSTTTGAINGTPTVSGTFPVLVSASNTTGAGAPVVVTFTINPSASLVAP